MNIVHEKCIFFNFQRSFWPLEVPVFATLDLMLGETALFKRLISMQMLSFMLLWWKCFIKDTKNIYFINFILYTDFYWWYHILKDNLKWMYKENWERIILQQNGFNNYTLFSCVLIQVLWEILTKYIFAFLSIFSFCAIHSSKLCMIASIDVTGMQYLVLPYPSGFLQ